ncbi:hypothetical protein V1264_001987 [Littorina saxatilis]
MDLALLDLKGPNYGVDELCVAGGNRVTIVIRCSSGSRYSSQASLNPCMEHEPLVSLQYDGASGKENNVSLLLWLNMGHDVVDSAKHSFEPSMDIFKSHKIVGDLRGTRFNFAIAQRCGMDGDEQTDNSVQKTVNHPWQNDDAVAPLTKNTPPNLRSEMAELPTDRHRRETEFTESTTPVSEGFLPTEPTENEKYDAVMRETEEEEEEEDVMGEVGEEEVEEEEEEEMSDSEEIVENAMEEDFVGEEGLAEGLASVEEQIGEEASENYVVASEENVEVQELETATSGDGGLSADASINDNILSSGATTPSDRMTPSDPTLVRLAGMIAKARAATTAPSTTVAQTTAAVPESTADPSEKMEGSSENNGLKRVSMPNKLLPSASPSAAESADNNRFSLDTVDQYNDDNFVIEARQLTLSPFSEGTYDATDEYGEEYDVTGSLDVDNATSSLFGGVGSSTVTSEIPDFDDATTAAMDEGSNDENSTSSLPNLTPKPTPITTTTTTTPPTMQHSASGSQGNNNSDFQAFGSESSAITTALPTTFTPTDEEVTSAASVKSITDDKTIVTPTTKNQDSNATTTSSDIAQTTAPSKANQDSKMTTTTKRTPTVNPDTDNSTTTTSTPPHSQPDNASPSTKKQSDNIFTLPTRTTVAPYNTTLMMGSSGNSSGLALNPDISSAEDDAFWPIVAALVIGIPSIIVFGIAITVIHKRRLASPARLRAASMYPSL